MNSLTIARLLKRLLPLVGLTVATVFCTIFLYTKLMDYEEEHCWSELRSTAQDVNQEITTKLQDEFTKLHLLEAIVLDSDRFTVEDINILHLELVQPTTIFSRLDVLYPDGTFFSNGAARMVSDAVDFDEVARKGTYLTDRKTDPITGEECVYYVLPILSEDTVLAVLIGMLSCQELSDYFQPAIYSGKAQICVLDSSDGNYIIDSWHTDFGNLYENGTRKMLKKYEGIDLRETLRNMETRMVAFESRTTGQPLYMYFTPVGMYDWQLAIFATEEVFFGEIIAFCHMFALVVCIEVLLLLCYFLWNIRAVRTLEHNYRKIEKQREELRQISYMDLLTLMFNRNKYISVLELLKERPVQNMGVVYVDLNGLKQINDTLSHEAGDRYIQSAADALKKNFPGNAYRIGGDEFVAMEEQWSKEHFEEQVAQLRQDMQENRVSVAVGAVWSAECESVEGLVKQAEEAMYAEKRSYYKTHDRRR